VCTACPAGTTNAADDDASGADTTCDATLCAENEKVVSNVCTACPAGTTNAANDDPTGADTTCDATLPGGGHGGDGPSADCLTCHNECNCNSDDTDDAACQTCHSACDAGSRCAGGDGEGGGGGDDECYATAADMPEEEIAMYATITSDCTAQLTACDIDLVAMEVCNATKPACVETVDACKAAGVDAKSGGVDATACAAAAGCEVASWTMGDETMEECVPTTGDGRAARDCIMDSLVEQEAAEAAANACGADEMVETVDGRGECVPCPVGTSNAAGDDRREGPTQCDDIVCAVNEYVLAHTCQSCPTGFTNDEGDEATGVNTACAPPVVTGMCQGNTDDAEDVACPPLTHIPVADPQMFEGTDEAACCQEIPEEDPEVTYKWQSTAWETVCQPSCAPSAKTRTVTCQETTLYPSTGSIVRVQADEDSSCTAEQPAESADCPVIPAGGECDDREDDTSFDECVVVEAAAAVCQGLVQLASAATLDIDIEQLAADAIPDTAGLSAEAAVAAIDASPVALAVKPPLALGLGVEQDAVTITGIGAGSIAVDFVVAVAEADVADTQTAASTAAPAVTIPATASASGEVVTATAEVAELKSYAYVKTPGTCPAACSNNCGAEAVSATDVYTCEEDGTTVSLATCAPTLGAAPETSTLCCEAADPDTCEESGRSATSCAVDQYVTADGVCEDCAAGTTNPLELFSVSATEQILVGDSQLGAATTCTATLCAVDEYVSSNACVACAAGKTNADGADDASGDDTTCAATLCAVDEYVSSNACVACAADTTNAAGDDASGADTACAAAADPIDLNEKTSAAPAAAAPLSALALALLCATQL